MAVQPEGTPCWADAMFPDVEAAKGFYGELLGWTFGESAEEYGGYTQAYKDGSAVAAVYPRMPGEENPAAWNLYFATTDAAATAEAVKAQGGSLVAEPMTVGDFGTMVVARDPGGLYFSAWQAAGHEGFERTGEPGAYAWAELMTRDAERTDAFFTSLFPFTVRRMDDSDVDYHVWQINGQPVAGRMLITDEVFPADVPSFINIYFAVPDTDAVLEKAGRLGARTVFGPMSSPFGRFATLQDQHGAVFSVIDLGTTEGEVPEFD
jgi:uncharacterized protein